MRYDVEIDVDNEVDRMREDRAIEEMAIKDLEGLIYTNLYKLGFWYRYPNHREDMIQEGRMAIVKAVRGFDPNANVKLSTYAYTLIRNAIYDYAQSMKLYQEGLLYPFYDEFFQDPREFSLDVLALLKLMEEQDDVDILREYFLEGKTQETIAEKHDKKQQAVSVIINMYRSKAREMFGLE